MFDDLTGLRGGGACAPAATDPPESSIALAPYPQPPSRSLRVLDHAAAAGRRPRVLLATTMLAAVSVTLLVLGSPLLSAGVAAVGTAQLLVAVGVHTRAAMAAERARGLFALPLAPEVEPHEIKTPVLRESYLAILRVHEEIRRALVDADHIQPALRAVFERCRATALASGRIARLGNPLCGYLAGHDPARIRDELDRLAASAEHTDDPQAVRTYAHAAAARARQLETHRSIERLRDRIRARLELSHASLESVAALVVELQVRDLEEVELASESVSEQLQALHEELELLEQGMAEAEWEPAAAPGPGPARRLPPVVSP